MPGGDRGIRTPDLCDANAALSLLSYIPRLHQDYNIHIELALVLDLLKLITQLSCRYRYLDYLSLTPTNKCLTYW